jgi:hypothetical protein
MAPVSRAAANKQTNKHGPAAVAEWLVEAPRDWRVASSQPDPTKTLDWTQCQSVASAKIGLGVGNACTYIHYNTCKHTLHAKYHWYGSPQEDSLASP